MVDRLVGPHCGEHRIGACLGGPLRARDRTRRAGLIRVRRGRVMGVLTGRSCALYSTRRFAPSKPTYVSTHAAGATAIAGVQGGADPGRDQSVAVHHAHQERLPRRLPRRGPFPHCSVALPAAQRSVDRITGCSRCSRYSRYSRYSRCSRYSRYSQYSRCADAAVPAAWRPSRPRDR